MSFIPFFLPHFVISKTSDIEPQPPIAFMLTAYTGGERLVYTAQRSNDVLGGGFCLSLGRASSSSNQEEVFNDNYYWSRWHRQIRPE